MPRCRFFQGRPETSVGPQELACVLWELPRAGDMGDGCQLMGLPYAQGQPGGEGNLWVLAWDELLCLGTGVEKVHPPNHLLLQGISLRK